MKRLFILSGPSGSGKSTWVKSLQEAAVCSADDFFINDGVYTFNQSLIAVAHSACMRNFLQHVNAGTQTIIIDNTNLRQWEWQNYVEAARLEYEAHLVLFIARTVADIKLCAARNKHGTPIDVIAKMAIEHEYENFDLSLFKSTQYVPMSWYQSETKTGVV